MRFGIIQGLDGDGRDTTLFRVCFGVPAGFAAHKERDFLEFFLGRLIPNRLTFGGDGLGRNRSFRRAGQNLDLGLDRALRRLGSRM